MQALKQEQIERLTESRYRGWVTHYWEELCLVAPDMSFSEKKEAFFYLLQQMLCMGRIKLGKFENSAEDWNEKPEVIISALRDLWPANAKSENDVELTVYFYQYIAVAWLGPDGEWHNS